MERVGDVVAFDTLKAIRPNEREFVVCRGRFPRLVLHERMAAFEPIKHR